MYFTHQYIYMIYVLMTTDWHFSESLQRKWLNRCKRIYSICKVERSSIENLAYVLHRYIAALYCILWSFTSAILLLSLYVHHIIHVQNVQRTALQFFLSLPAQYKGIIMITFGKMNTPSPISIQTFARDLNTLFI